MIYLDNAATSFPKAPGVAQAVYDYLKNGGANAGRASYKSAQDASIAIFETRELLARLLNVEQSEQILFTANATQALNTAIFGLTKPGDTILTSSMEHNAVIRPLRYLEKEKQIQLLFFHCDKFGFPDVTDFKKKLQKKPAFVITTGCSNVTGSIFPFMKMAMLAKENGTLFCLDAAQLIGDFPLDLASGTIDILCFSGHKGLLSPTGTGGLYLQKSLSLPPRCFGGTGSRSDSEYQPDFLPDKYESGTPNIAGIVGLKSSLEFILQETVEKIFQKKQELFKYFYTQMDSMQAFQIVSPALNQIGILSVVPKFTGISDFTQHLNDNEIAVRMGFHCAPQAHKTIGTDRFGGTVRFSPGYFTQKEEIDQVLSIIQNLI